jgi:hypothetical protein
MWSPYSAMNDNPILNNDPFGDTLVSKADKKEAAYQNQQLQNTKTNLKNTIKANAGKILGAFFGGGEKMTQKQFNKLINQTKDLQGRVGEVDKSMNDLEEIKQDPCHGYTFNRTPGADHGTTTVDDDGHIVLSYPNTDLFAHELRHADKVYHGILTPDLATKNFALHGWSREAFEVDSYRAQYGVNPKGLPNSTTRTVNALTDINQEWVPWCTGQ